MNILKKLFSLLASFLVILSLIFILNGCPKKVERKEVGKKIAFTSNRDGNYEIYVMNSDGSEQINLTNNPADDGYTSWSPDGKKIAFTSARDGNNEIYVMNEDGSEQIRLTDNPADDGYPAFQP